MPRDWAQAGTEADSNVPWIIIEGPLRHTTSALLKRTANLNGRVDVYFKVSSSARQSDGDGSRAGSTVRIARV
jgi:hypothetical protein